jgi:hypothetical protein
MEDYLKMMNFGSYNPIDYEKYLDPKCGVNRPSLLDKFLMDPRTSKMVDNHCTKLHIAIIVKRGKILATATNKTASRSNGASSRGSQNFIHAEKNLLRSVDLSKMRGADIYVMRVRMVGDEPVFGYSQPCPECTVLLNKCIREYGLKNVYFTK